MHRVADVRFPVGKSQFQRLYLYVDGLRAIILQGGQVVPFQDVQRL